MNITDYFDKPAGIYALSHSVGPLTRSAKKAINSQYLHSWASLGGDAWPAWLSEIDVFCEQIAKVINAAPDEICPQTNLASGFYSFLTAIAKRDKSQHKDTIVMHKDAFASMGFVVAGLASTFNIKLHLIDAPVNSSEAWQQAFEEHKVLACLITHVHSNTSVKSDVTKISKIAKSFNVVVCVDIAQSVGIVPIDLSKWAVDAVFGSCVKWLCGGPGAGFMYVKNALIPELEPDPIGWFSHQNPFEFDINHYVPAANAMRFWGGTPSVAPYILAAASIASLFEIGFDNLVTHNKNLKLELLNNLPDHRNYEAIKKNYKALGGSLCIEAVNTEKTRLLLIDNNVKFDERNSIFRISMHATNTIDEAQVIASCFR